MAKRTSGSPPARTKGAPTSGRRARAQAARAAQRRKRATRWGIGAAGVAIVVGVALAVSASGGGSTITTPTAWVLPKLEGPGDVSLASLRGKPVVANFFASWCSECRFELPSFAKAASDLRGKVTFVEVDSLETGNGTAMSDQYGLAGAGAILAKDVGGANGSGLHDALGGGNNMPVSAFYDAQGHLLTTHVGAYTASALAAELHQLYRLRA